MTPKFPRNQRESILDKNMHTHKHTRNNNNEKF